jgi:hypothetical protein
MTEQIELLRIEVAKLELKPGDMLLFQHPTAVRAEQVRSIYESLRRVVPPTIPFLIVPHGVTVTQVRSPIRLKNDTKEPRDFVASLPAGGAATYPDERLPPDGPPAERITHDEAVKRGLVEDGPSGVDMARQQQERQRREQHGGAGIA